MQTTINNLESNGKWWVLFSIGVGTFMSALDISIINTILPIVTKEFQAAVNQTEWISLIYLLFVSGLLPSFGRLGDLKGHKSIYLTGFVLFILGSLLCALSPSVFFLILSRSLQAFGAAMLSSNSPAILTKNFPSTQRGQALGLQATMTYLGLTIGPSLGGWLTELWGWRSVFTINIPVGICAFLLSAYFIPKEKPHSNFVQFDYFGALLFLSGLTSLLLGLSMASEWGWISAATIGLNFCAIILVAIFVWWEKHIAEPMLDLNLFSIPTISRSIFAAVINYLCVYSNLFLMPFYLLQGRSFLPARAGLIISIQPLIMAITAPISGTLSDKIGTRIPALLGMIILASGTILLSLINNTTPIFLLLCFLAIFGLGIGIFITPNSSAIMGSAPINQIGIAAGLLATARNVGMVLGIGISGAVFTTVLSRYNASLVDGIFPAIHAAYFAAFLISLLGVMVTGLGKD
ncbi:MAG: MFS transporter [Anaerolineales bacterium]